MRDILVHLDDGERSAVRLEIAIGLAQRFNARLTGLFARSDSDRSSAVAQRPSEHLVAARTRVAEDFAGRTASAGLSTRWWALSHGAPDHVVGETMFCARHADLVIMGQQGEDDSHLPAELVEHTILNCGRPVLVLPRYGQFAAMGERIVVAWNASREAVRALADARPLLERAGTVTVLSLLDGEGGGAGMVQVPHVDIIDYLENAGIKARTERAAGENIGKMDLLLSRLCDLGADLVVMGAHHSEGFPFHRGSATRYVLEHMTVPVLMSN